MSKTKPKARRLGVGEFWVLCAATHSRPEEILADVPSKDCEKKILGKFAARFGVPKSELRGISNDDASRILRRWARQISEGRRPR